MQIPTNPMYDIDENATVRLISSGTIIPEYRSHWKRKSVKIRGKSHKPSSHSLDRLMLITYKPISPNTNYEWLSIKFLNGNKDDIRLENMEWDNTWYHPTNIPGISVPIDFWIPVHGHPRIEIKVRPDGIYFRDTETYHELGLIEKDGYYYVKIPRVPDKIRVHRLVALALLPHPIDTDHLTVNHKDSDPSNNYPFNLEWATYTQNNFHSYSEGPRGETIRKIVAKDLSDDREMEFAGYHEAARYLGVLPGSMHAAMDRRRFEGRPYKGHVFRYFNDNRSWQELAESGPVERRSVTNKIACMYMDTNDVVVHETFRDALNKEQIGEHALYRLLSKKELIPWRRKCFQEVKDNQPLVWPDYPKEILRIYEEVHASDRPIKVTDKDGDAGYYPNVTKWCMEDRENRCDPAVLSRYLKKTNQWRDWVFEHIDLNKYLPSQFNN